MPKTMLIKVTREDVDVAYTSVTVSDAPRSTSCPIARALARRTGGDARVGRELAYYTDPENGVRMAAPLTPQAKAFVAAFDRSTDLYDTSILPWPKTFRLTFW